MEEKQRQIVVTYSMNVNFEPSGDNLRQFACDKVNYFWPAHPSMNVSGFVSPSPVGYSCIRKDTGECLQIMIYQVVDIHYIHGFEAMMKRETKKAHNAIKKNIELMKLDTPQEKPTENWADTN